MNPAVFGQFSYSSLNPLKIPSDFGYYDGDLEYISLKVPECLRYLSAIYAGTGLLGSLMLLPVIRHNQK